MKKFLAIAIISATMVACNNNGDADKTEKDSIQSVDSAAAAQKDSVEHASDSTKNKIDSSAGAKKDSIKKN